MKYIARIAKGISEGKTEGEIRQLATEGKKELEQEITKLGDESIEEILNLLFPGEIPGDSKFYDVLQKFQHYSGYGPAFHSLAGRVWAIAYRGLEHDKRKVLLDSVFQEKGRGVWRAIFLLPEFCSRIDIEPEFAAGWFYRFGDAVKNDMANWDFFNGVKNYAFNFPMSGMKVFEVYVSEQLDNLKISLAALLLGTIRSQVAQGRFDRAVVEHWDSRIRTSPQINMRLIYHRSLPTSFDMGSLSTQELDCELTKMLKGTPEEISEAFSIIWRCLKSERADDDFVKFAMNWFSKNATSKLPDFAKYHLVNAMWFFRTPGKEKINIQASEADDLLIAIQPIQDNNRGTWDYLEMYLVERLKQDPAAFENILERLVNANPEGMVNQFRGEVLDHLKSELCQAKVHDFVTRWSLSTDTNKREIAGDILQKAESIVLSPDVISEASEKQLEIVLLEFIRKPTVVAEKVGAYLLALERAFRDAKPALKEKFKNEMILQAINYPGACLDKWKKIENQSELLKEVIASAEKYFERLNAIKDSPAISFTFPGCKEAAEREASEFSNKVSKEAREKSIFANLVKNVQIIYGTKWAIMMVDGKLGPATDFNELGHSMEFPRIEIIDPEGMAIRRVQSRMQSE